MIDRELKRSLGQMVKGVQVVGASHEGVERAYTSHWVCQVSFEEPIVMASVSPKHDTFPLLEASGDGRADTATADHDHAFDSHALQFRLGYRARPSVARVG